MNFQIIISFICVGYLLPRISFFAFLRNRPIWVKIVFSLCCSILISTFVAITLGLMIKLSDSLFKVTICSIYFLAFIINLVFVLVSVFKQANKAGNSYWQQIKESLSQSISNKITSIKSISSIMEYIVIIVVIIISVLFANWLITNGYSFIAEHADYHLHARWIAELHKGIIYAQGIYPYGMHCFYYLLQVFFNINANIIQNYGAFCIDVFGLIMLFMFFREMFKNNYYALISFVLVVCLLLSGLYYTESVANMIEADPNYVAEKMVYEGLYYLKWNLPMNFALFTVFSSAICILRLSNKKWLHDKKVPFYTILLGLSVAAAACVHTYLLLFQFIICCVIGLFRIRYFKLVSFLSACAASIGGLLVGMLPILVSLNNYKPEFALSWAGGIIQGTYSPEMVTTVQSEMSGTVGSGTTASEAKKQILDKIDFNSAIHSIVHDGLYPLFKDYWPLFLCIVVVTILIAVFILIMRKVKDNSIVKHKNGETNFWPTYETVSTGFIFITIFAVFFTLYAAPLVALPRLLESFRVVLMMFIMSAGIVMCPIAFIVDTVISKVKSLKKKETIDPCIEELRLI